MKYIGTFNSTNVGGCGITKLTDAHVYFEIYTDKVLSKHKLKLYYTRKGAYFNYHNRIYLTEIIRTDI